MKDLREKQGSLSVTASVALGVCCVLGSLSFWLSVVFQKKSFEKLNGVNVDRYNAVANRWSVLPLHFNGTDAILNVNQQKLLRIDANHIAEEKRFRECAHSMGSLIWFNDSAQIKSAMKQALNAFDFNPKTQGYDHNAIAQIKCHYSYAPSTKTAEDNDCHFHQLGLDEMRRLFAAWNEANTELLVVGDSNGRRFSTQLWSIFQGVEWKIPKQNEHDTMHFNYENDGLRMHWDFVWAPKVNDVISFFTANRLESDGFYQNVLRRHRTTFNYTSDKVAKNSKINASLWKAAEMRSAAELTHWRTALVVLSIGPHELKANHSEASITKHVNKLVTFVSRFKRLVAWNFHWDFKRNRQWNKVFRIDPQSAMQRLNDSDLNAMVRLPHFEFLLIGLTSLGQPTSLGIPNTAVRKWNERLREATQRSELAMLNLFNLMYAKEPTENMKQICGEPMCSNVTALNHAIDSGLLSAVPSERHVCALSDDNVKRVHHLPVFNSVAIDAILNVLNNAP